VTIFYVIAMAIGVILFTTCTESIRYKTLKFTQFNRQNMQAITLIITSIFFLYMAYMAFFKPKNIYRSLGLREITIDATNEIFGVYGGYGLITGILLLYSLTDSKLADYVQLIVGLSLIGMALGRLLGFISERKPVGKFVKIYFVSEILIGCMSLIGWYYAP
jgi:hypothetical protein